MARPVKSYSELQRQLINAQLAGRDAARRQADHAARHAASDDAATAPYFVPVLAAVDRR